MKKIGEMMKEIGFNPQGSDAVKEAFVKNLVKQAWGVNIQTPTEKRIISENPGKFVALKKSEISPSHHQMAFDFNENSKNTDTKKAI